MHGQPDGPPARRAGRRPLTRPLPDPVAIRTDRIPGTAPPYDDQAAGPLSAERRPAGIPRPRAGAGRSPGGNAGPGPGRRVAASRREQPAAAGRRAVPGRPGGPPWPSRFAQVLTETLAGSRPPGQITPWTTERARSHIRKLGPLLMAEQRPVVRRVVTSRPAPGVVEMTVVVGVAGRVRALAIRLELHGARGAAPGRPGSQARWVCTTVQAA